MGIPSCVSDRCDDTGGEWVLVTQRLGTEDKGLMVKGETYEWSSSCDEPRAWWSELVGERQAG